MWEDQEPGETDGEKKILQRGERQLILKGEKEIEMGKKSRALKANQKQRLRSQ